MKVRQGQTIWDLVIQSKGKVDGLADVLKGLTDINVSIPVGTEIEDIENNNSIARYFDGKTIATEGGEIAGSPVTTFEKSTLGAGVVVSEGQSIWDLVLNHYGQVDGLSDIIRQFDDLGNIPVGASVVIATNTNPVAQYFRNRVLATLGGEILLPVTGYSAEALAVFAKMPNPLTDFEKIGIAAFVDQMVLDGNWSKLDYFYGFFLSDIDNACTSWIGTKTATRVNSPTHDSKGFLFNGTTQYVDTNINMSTDLVNATQNDNYTSSYIYSNLDTATGKSIFSSRAGTTYHEIQQSNVNLLRVWVNFISSRTNFLGSDAKFSSLTRYSIYRTSINDVFIEKNGAIQATTTETSLPFPNSSIYVARTFGTTLYLNAKISYKFIGAANMDLPTLQTACSALNIYFGLDV